MRMGARQACVLCAWERVRRVYYAYGNALGACVLCVLEFNEASVIASELEQLGMCSALNDTSFMQHADEVGSARGG